MRAAYPKTLRPIHRFQVDGRAYVADLLSGKVIEITPAMCDLLKCCTVCDFHQIIDRLSQMYEEPAISEAIEQFERFEEAGLLFEQAETPLHEIETERLKLFTPMTGVDSIEAFHLPFMTRLNHYHLVRAAGQFADISVNLSKEQSLLDGAESSQFIGEEGIFPVVLDEETLRSCTLVKHVPKACDGVLLLSGHPTADLPFFFHQQAPVICRIESSPFQPEVALELALNAKSASRPWDALCVESSWLKDWLSNFVTSPDSIHVIANGVDEDFLASFDKVSAKQTIAQIWGSESIIQQPMVGLFPGFEKEIAARFVVTLANCQPQIGFLVFDSVLERVVSPAPDNVLFFQAENLQERRLLPTIFRSMDLFCFPTLPRISASIVVSAMACGVPAIVIGAKLPPEIGNAGVLVESPTPRLPFAALSTEIESLLKDKSQHAELSADAARNATKYTWNQTAQALIQLFHQLNGLKQTAGFTQQALPVVFSRYYDKAQESVKTLAFRPVNQSYQSVKDALAQVLLTEHRPGEVECVLKHFWGEKDTSPPLTRLKDRENFTLKRDS